MAPVLSWELRTCPREERLVRMSRRYILAIGRSRVGIITGPLNSYAGRRRDRGARSALVPGGSGYRRPGFDRVPTGR